MEKTAEIHNQRSVELAEKASRIIVNSRGITELEADLLPTSPDLRATLRQSMLPAVTVDPSPPTPSEALPVPTASPGLVDPDSDVGFDLVDPDSAVGFDMMITPFAPEKLAPIAPSSASPGRDAPTVTAKEHGSSGFKEKTIEIGERDPDEWMREEEKKLFPGDLVPDLITPGSPTEPAPIAPSAPDRDTTPTPETASQAKHPADGDVDPFKPKPVVADEAFRSSAERQLQLDDSPLSFPEAPEPIVTDLDEPIPSSFSDEEFALDDATDANVDDEPAPFDLP